MKISEAFDLYKNNYMFVKKQCRRNLENQEFVKNRLISAIGDIDICEITLDDIHEWVEKISYYTARDGSRRERVSNTIRNDLTRLRMVLKYMRLLGYDCLNPELIPMPKREDVVRPYLTAEEVDKMIDCAYSLRNKVVISLLYSSGIRLSEMIALNRNSIVDRCFTVVGKGSKSRLCFIDERTEKLIDEYMESRKDDCSALVISYKNKARMTPTNVQLLVKNSAARARIDKKVTPHILRHSFATNFISNNGNIRYLSAMLGHASLNTTAIYTHVVDNDLKTQYQRFHSI